MNFFWSYQQLSAYELIKYGYLYNDHAAKDARNIANTGWHVPTRTEIQALQTALGGDAVAGGKMKETGFVYWNSPNTSADNSSGFNGKGSGIRDHSAGDFSLINELGRFWTSTSYDSNNTYTWYLNYNSAAMRVNVGEPFARGLAIRLVKDSGTATTYTGNDGKVYRCVTIGGVTYMADNLAETEYRDGSTIPVVTDNAIWAALTTGARCVYNNDESNK